MTENDRKGREQPPDRDDRSELVEQSSTDHSEVTRETSGTIVDNYTFDGGLEWYGRDLRYGNNETWTCECGDSFDSKEGIISHMNNIDVPQNTINGPEEVDE